MRRILAVEERRTYAHCLHESASRTGETIELLPVHHETDVKKELNGLLEGWHSSGFLIWERFVYPWHQVKSIEVAVESLSNAEAGQRMLGLHGADRARLHEEFWKGARKG